MQPRRVSNEHECGVTVNAAPRRGQLSEELSAYRFSTMLAQIQTTSPTPPLFQSTLASVCSLPELPGLQLIKPRLSSLNATTPSVSENGVSVTGNFMSISEKANTTILAEVLLRETNEMGQSPNPVPNNAPVFVVPLSALPARFSQQQLTSLVATAPALLPPPHVVTTNATTNTTTSTLTVPECDSQKNHTCLRGPSHSNGTKTAVPVAHDRVSQPSCRITFMVDARDNARSVAAAAPAPPHRNVLGRRLDPVLHSEVGVYELEYLDGGGKLQQHLTSFYHYCAVEDIPPDDNKGLMLADHLGPCLRESRHFREYVVGDIDRSCGVVNTAVTLLAREEHPIHAVGSAASENGTDTTTLSGTVVNAVRDDVAPGLSELRESYQPLQIAVFDSALRKAWEWKQRGRAETAAVASPTTDVATVNGCDATSLPQWNQRLSDCSPVVTSTLFGRLSEATSTSKDGARASALGDVKTYLDKVVSSGSNGGTNNISHHDSGRNAAVPRREASSFSSYSLPTFQAEVKAGLRLDDLNDPYAPLPPLQLAACELCGAELISRKVLLTSYLAERYEMVVSLTEVTHSCSDVRDATPTPGSFDTMLARNSTVVQHYFDLTLEMYLPWMADLYLAEYKLIPLAVRTTDKAANTAPIFARKFRSVVRPSAAPPSSAAAAAAHAATQVYCRPPPLAGTLQGLPAAAGKGKMPSVASFLRKNDTTKLPQRLSAPLSAQHVVFSTSFLIELRFIVLEELAIAARAQLPDIVTDTMNQLIPGATSLTRNSLFTSLMHSASLSTVPNPSTIAQKYEVLTAAARSADGGDAASAANAAIFESAAAGASAVPTATATDNASADVAVTNTVATSGIPVSSRLLQRLTQMTKLNEQPAPPHTVHSETSLQTSETLAAERAKKAADASAARRAARHCSHYELSCVWLKIFFCSFHSEEAYNFMSDSPIAMRNFLPLPRVSYERILLHSRMIMAWFEFHSSIAAATASMWDFHDKTIGSWKRQGKQKQNSRKPWGQQQWDRSLRHCEQEALKIAAAIHELWYLAREWWLQFMLNVFRSTSPAPFGSATGGKRRSSNFSSAIGRRLTPWPPTSPPSSPPSRSLVGRRLRPMDPTVYSPSPTNDKLVGADSKSSDQGFGSLLFDTSASRRTLWPNYARSLREYDASCGSPPSVSSSQVVWGSDSTSLSRPTGRPVNQVTVVPLGNNNNNSNDTVQTRPVMQRFGSGEIPQQLQGSFSSTADGSGFSLSARSVMGYVSQPNPIHKEQRSQEAMRDAPATAATVGCRSSALPDIHFPPSGLVTLALQNGAYDDAAADLEVKPSRVVVSPLTATISGFFHGHASDWDTVLLVRCQSLIRAVNIEQAAFEVQQLASMMRSGAARLDTCAVLEDYTKTQEDALLAHRRNPVKYVWDQLCMEKHLYLLRWSQERSRLDMLQFALLSHESLAELQLDVLARLAGDFHLIYREAWMWVPAAAAVGISVPSLSTLSPQQEQQRRSCLTAAIALGPSNSNSTTDVVAAAVCRTSGGEGGKTAKPSDKARCFTNMSFDYWGYGAFLPPAESPLGFNDGLVLMARVCRDMHLRGRQRRMHWFVDDNDYDGGKRGNAGSVNFSSPSPLQPPVQSFHEIHYANYDIYTGFMRVQLSEESDVEAQQQMELRPDEAHTPRVLTDSMTDIHRDGEGGAGQLLRHGLGYYTCKALGYTYVGGWYLDRPHGDGGLLYIGVLPWETRSEAAEKSLLLIFGRWEYGRLVHVEVMFTGTPLG